MSTEPDQNRLEELANKYLKGTISPSEQREFDEWFKTDSNTPTTVPSEIAESEEEHRKLILARIHQNMAVSKPVRSLWPRIAAAASILLLLSIGSYFLLHRGQSQQTAQIAKQDIAPGSNKAVLTLANGKKIILTGAKNGLLANQGNTKINKTADGQVVYHAAQSANDQLVYNTMTTPRGGQYHLTLADGTNVWLNAASSIKYPTAFTGKDRQVEITGEAYFEVAHNAAKPFRVTSNGQTVEVLGTHFNVNAYDDEPAMITTLLEGSVKIAKAGQMALLKPGQQASVVEGITSIQVQEINTEEAVAWKEGAFYFNKTDIKNVMRQISRWYDVDISYEGGIPQSTITGKVHRNVNASQALKILSYLDIHFRIDGKRIIITNP